MTHARAARLDRAVDERRDHILGNSNADMTLVEYGSYACPYCHAAHEIIAGLRDRFGDLMRYVFRHRPIPGSDEAERAAELAEYASKTTGRFWPVHDALMKQGAALHEGDLEQIASEFDLPPRDRTNEGGNPLCFRQCIVIPRYALTTRDSATTILAANPRRGAAKPGFTSIGGSISGARPNSMPEPWHGDSR